MADSHNDNRSQATTDKLPTQRRSINQDRFTFRTVHGKVIDIPAFLRLPRPIVRALKAELRAVEEQREQGENPDEPDFSIAADTDAAAKLIDQLDTIDYVRFTKLYMQQAQRDTRIQDELPKASASSNG